MLANVISVAALLIACISAYLMITIEKRLGRNIVNDVAASLNQWAGQFGAQTTAAIEAEVMKVHGAFVAAEKAVVKKVTGRGRSS